MDEPTRLRMRRAHANHAHTCDCGKVVFGNGGWASHAWSCATYQTRHHATLDYWHHNQARCGVCTRTPYVGEGADGCRRSAQVDREEADTLHRDDPRRGELLDSAQRWEAQAERLDKA